MEVDSWETYGEFPSQPCLIGAGNDEVLGFLGINMDKVVHLGRESSAKMGQCPAQDVYLYVSMGSIPTHCFSSETIDPATDHLIISPQISVALILDILWSGMKPSFIMWASRCQSIIINLS